MKKELISEIKELTKEDKHELVDILLTMLSKESNCNKNTKCCPTCKSTEFVKFGHQKSLQRYRCKCGKTFSENATSLTYCSKIDINTWKQFINYEISGLPLKEISFYLGISVITCFRLRHKLYSACEKYIDGIKLQGQTEIDCSYVSINLKGTKPQNMPRMSKKHGKTSTYRGLSHHKVCVVVGIDEYDNHFMKVAGLGPESFEKYKKFSLNFEKSSLLISDSKPCIAQFANHLKISNDSIKTIPNGKRYTTDQGNNIQSLNEFCKCIPDVIHKYHGVSLRHFNGYLAFQSLKKMIHYQKDRKEMASQFINLLVNQSHLLSLDISKEKIPADLKEAYWEFNYGIYKH